MPKQKKQQGAMLNTYLYDTNSSGDRAMVSLLPEASQSLIDSQNDRSDGIQKVKDLDKWMRAITDDSILHRARKEQNCE